MESKKMIDSAVINSVQTNIYDNNTTTLNENCKLYYIVIFIIQITVLW